MDIETILENLGLNDTEARVYQAIANGDAHKPAELAETTEIKRPTVYHALEQLVHHGLVEEVSMGNTKHYKMADPEQLRSLYEAKEAQLEATNKTLESIIPQLVSQYRMSTGKPHVQYFEGVEGVKKAAKDILSADGETYVLTDRDAFQRQYPELTDWFLRQNKKQTIPKKVLYPKQVKPGQGVTQNPNLEYRILPSETSFSAVVYIYNKKVTFITLEQHRLIAFIIEDSAVYMMLRLMFEYMWDSATASGGNSGSLLDPSFEESA